MLLSRSTEILPRRRGYSPCPFIQYPATHPLFLYTTSSILPYSGTPALLHHIYSHSPEVPPDRSSITCNPPHQTVILFPNSVPPTFSQSIPALPPTTAPRVHLLAHTLSPERLPQPRLTLSRATISKLFSSLAVVPTLDLPKPTFGLVSFSTRTPPHTCSSVGPVALEKVVDWDSD